ncbi:MAG: hypothetical protein C0439_15550 [Pseudomonas sp.]|nr:hypothetical protein [Pseudomonas sp.]
MSNAHDTLIGNVPATIISLARFQVAPYEGRVAEFNIATWLHLPGLANVAVSLLISYQDGATRREVVIDHGKVNTHGKILLSSVARLPVKQKIEQMQVRLRSALPAGGLVVEELFVQAVESAQLDTRQALA